MQVDFTPNENPRDPRDPRDPQGDATPRAGGVAIPVPGLGATVGLGEAVARALVALGLGGLGQTGCGGCKQRADAMDRVARFVPWD